MSDYCGKCDFADTVAIEGEEVIINKFKVFLYDQFLPFEIKEPKDLVPYYPYIVCIMTSNKETGGTICLSNESYVDEEERRQLQGILEDGLKYWRKCKKEKKEFNIDDAIKRIHPFHPEDYEIEIIKRISEFGNKATIDDIHMPSFDRYRQLLYEEMINSGWEEDRSYRWCYGFTRWLNRKKEENGLYL